MFDLNFKFFLPTFMKLKSKNCLLFLLRKIYKAFTLLAFANTRALIRSDCCKKILRSYYLISTRLIRQTY